MKKIIATICAVMIAFCGLIAIPAGNAWATMTEKQCADLGTNWRTNEECKKNCAETSLLGTLGDSGIRLKCDEGGDGEATKDVLKLVIDIISIIIGVAGVTAIVIVGIMYLTAGPDVGKAVKARTRLIEIVIGLILYALTYAILNFLIPNFKTNNNSTSRVEEPTTSLIAEK